MQYAIIETGSKQYRAEKGAEFDIEKVDVPEGKTLKLDRVLFFAENGHYEIGKPYIKGACAEAEVVRNYRLAKVISFKYIRREGGAKTKIGHRQNMTRIKILSIKKG